MTGSITSFKNVLLATDFSAASHTAFQTAVGVCSELRASLLIFHVFEYSNAVPPEAGTQLIELDSIYERLETLTALSVGHAEVYQ
jgi:hypothetical protein